jgi:Matrixin
MRRVSLSVTAVAVAALVGAAPAGAAARQSGEHVIAVDGVAKHRPDLRVEILVVVRSGASSREAGDRALESQDAKRAPDVMSTGFTHTGLYWDRLPVVQYYNPAGEPTAAAGTALRNTYGDWSSVRSSAFKITSGGTTSRCPSLVRGCAGGQRYDGFNDVGWAGLSGGTLGVTWYSTSVDEADMAISARYTWSTGCRQVPGAYDLETVYLHENGHVAGLGHSSDPSAVMYPSYQTARCALAQDDKTGLAALY